MQDGVMTPHVLGRVALAATLCAQMLAGHTAGQQRELIAAQRPGAIGAQPGTRDTETIEVDAQAQGRPFPHYWERMFGSGRAILTLRDSYRHDLREVKYATGKSNGVQTWRISIKGGVIIDRLGADADADCESESYEPI